MAELRKCRKCATDVPTNAPFGLCPQCLIALGFGPSSEGVVQSQVESAPPASPSSSDRIQYFGDYELVERIAQGGMGTVYKARQATLNRLVALKLISAGELATPELVKRFKAEAEAAASLSHPNIVPILEIGQHEGQHYFSMGLIDGPNLREALAALGRRGNEADEKARAGRSRDRQTSPPPYVRGYKPKNAAELLSIIARAVHYAHQRGVLHRDIKPSNILLDADGAPHLTDFGLAKLIEKESTLTHTNAILGTPAYMSPEQACGGTKNVTTATDVWGLGAVLYETLTGSPPFSGGTSMETIRQVINQEPRRPSFLNSAIDRDLETICLKCLEKEPGRRYGSAESFAADLDRWLRDEPILARRATPWERATKWTRRQPVLAASLALLLLALVSGVAGVVWQWQRAERNAVQEFQQRQRAEREMRRAENAEQDMRESLLSSRLSEAKALRVSGTPGRRFQTLSTLSNAAAIRPSLELRNEAVAAMTLVDIRRDKSWRFTAGKEACDWLDSLESYVVVDSSKAEISVRSAVDDHEIAHLAPPAGASGTPSLSGRNGNLVCVVFPKGGVHVWDLARGSWTFSAAGSYGDLSPDDRSLAVVAPRGEVIVYDMGSSNQVRTISPPGRVTWLRYDSSGQKLAVGPGLNFDEIHVLAVATGETLARLKHSGSISAFAWHPDGRHVATTDTSSRSIRIWDTVSNAVVRQVTGNENDGINVTFSHDGTLLASASWDGKVRLWEFATGEPLLTIAGGGVPRFGPNDKMVACKSGENLVLYDLASARELLVIHDEERRNGLSETIAFNSTGTLLAHKSGERVKICDGSTGRELAVLPIPAWGLHADPKSSGFLISADGRPCRLPVREVDSSGTLEIGPLEPFGPTNRAHFLPAVSADGEWCVLQPMSPNLSLRVDTKTGNEFVPLKAGHTGARWWSISPGGRWIASGAWHNPTVKIYDGNTGEVVKRLALDGMSSVAFSPDERWLMIGGMDFQFLETGTWELKRRLERPSGEGFPAAMAFSRDGKILALCHGWRTIRLINPHTGGELATLEAPKAFPISALSFNADASSLAVAGEKSRECHVWNLRLIRQQLAAINLDWEMPPYVPEHPVLTISPLRVIVHTNAPPNPTPSVGK